MKLLVYAPLLIIAAVNTYVPVQNPPPCTPKHRIAVKESCTNTEPATTPQNEQKTAPEASVIPQTNTIVNCAPTYEPAKEQKSHTPNYFDAGLIAVGLLQAVILGLTIKAIKNQTKSSENGQRAWIMVNFEREDEDAVKQGEDKTTVSVVAEYDNRGKSVAWITEARIKFDILDPFDGLPQKPYVDIPPEEKILLPWEPGKKEKRPVWKLTCFKKLGPKQEMIIYGIIKYRDVFSTERETGFGYRIDSKCIFTRLINYPEYNRNT
jgi:hypothetical protein